MRKPPPIEQAPAIQTAPEHRELHLIGEDELAQLDRFSLERRSRALASPLYLGNSRAICRILGRYKFFIDTRDEGFGSHLLLDGFWEGWLTCFLIERLKPGMVFADIGANFGYYSVLGADRVGPTGRVIAAEPNPAAASLLRKSLAVNGLSGSAHVVEAAISDGAAAEAWLQVPEHEPKNAHLVGAPPAENAERVIKVAVLSGDALLAGFGRVDIIKIDAEGAEDMIVRGLERTIAKHRPQMIVEFDPRRCQSPDELVTRLETVYGTFSALETDGILHPVGRSDLLERARADDWLIVVGG